jgi:hypothetical protein
MDMIRWRQSRIDPRPEHMLPAPYFEWARATGFAYYGKAKWLPVLIELKADGPLNDAQVFAHEVFRLQGNAHDAGWAAHLQLPPFFADRPARMRRATRFIAALVRKQFLDDLYANQPPADSILRFELGRATGWSADAAPAWQFEDAAADCGCLPTAVVTGVIDDGMAFAHDRFLDSDGKTRIEFVLDQHAPLGPWTELDKLDIDTMRAGNSHVGLVDEDALYRQSGHVDHAQPGHKPLATSLAHGTHVMDLACNLPGPAVPPARPAPGTRPIIAVQLPSATVQDTSGATLERSCYLALCYILWRADVLAQRCQCPPLALVVNLSYGFIAGPHDGSGLLEAAMDDLIQACNASDIEPFRVVLPAGNSHLSRCHAEFSLAPGDTQELHWRVLPDDWTESWVGVWLPPGVDVKTLAFEIIAPGGGQSSGSFVAGDAWDVVDGGKLVGKVCYYPPQTAAHRTLVRFAIAPTGAPDGGLALAPPGLWLIKVANPQGAAPVDGIHAWIQRDDTAPGFKRRGRQSYFDDPRYRCHDDGGRPIEQDPLVPIPRPYVRRGVTLNAIATGRQPIVVGGFRRGGGAAAPYSASGRALPPPGGVVPVRVGPDAMLPSEDAPSQCGVLAAGTRSGSCAAMNGTSVAAPLATQWIAERMAAGLPSDRPAIFGDALLGDPAQPPDKPPPERGGGGRVERTSNRRPRREP